MHRCALVCTRTSTVAYCTVQYSITRVAYLRLLRGALNRGESLNYEGEALDGMELN